MTSARRLQRTVTVPQPLRALAFHHPRLVYGALMRCAVTALQALAADPRFVGAQLGCIAVLHPAASVIRWKRLLGCQPSST